MSFVWIGRETPTFSHIKIGIHHLGKRDCMSNSLPMQISATSFFHHLPSPSAQPVAGSSLPSLQKPDSHHFVQLMWCWLPLHHSICLCIKLISSTLLYLDCTLSGAYINACNKETFFLLSSTLINKNIITIIVIKTVIIFMAVATD